MILKIFLPHSVCKRCTSTPSHVLSLIMIFRIIYILANNSDKEGGFPLTSLPFSAGKSDLSVCDLKQDLKGKLRLERS